MIIDKLKRVAANATQAYKEEKAHLQGKAISKARVLLNGKDIPEVAKGMEPGVPQAIPKANVRMHDGRAMTFFTDGSLRSSYGPRTTLSGRQARKQRKELRRLIKTKGINATQVRDALA